MGTLLRRLTIITLSLTIFAMLFAQLAQNTDPTQRRVHSATNAACYHPATVGCVAAL